MEPGHDKYVESLKLEAAAQFSCLMKHNVAVVRHVETLEALAVELAAVTDENIDVVRENIALLGAEFNLMEHIAAEAKAAAVLN